MNVPLGASGSSQMTAKLLVPSGAAPKERGGESFFPVQVNTGDIRPPAVSAGEVRSIVFIFVEAVDAAGDGLEVFVTFSVHPANTVANRIVTINMINNWFFIVIPSFGENFPLRCSQTASNVLYRHENQGLVFSHCTRIRPCHIPLSDLRP